MQVSAEQLRRIAKGTPNNDNVKSIVVALNRYGAQFGLDLPHRLAHYISQIAHESGGFHYDREIASGAAYEGRKDLGNTQKGDGKRFKGRTAMQLTGRTNYRAFTAWCRRFIHGCPDFEAQPELVNTDPYEGLVPIWYWDSRKLNNYADQNNLEMITRRINGGTNGLADRMDYYDRSAFILLGYKLGQYSEIQTTAKRKGWYAGRIDGDPGPQTRGAMHMLLVHMTDAADQPANIMAAPVVERKEVEKKVEVPVETQVPVPIPDSSLDKPFYKDPSFIERVATPTSLGSVSSFFAGLDWKIVAAVAALILVVSISAYFGIRYWKQQKQVTAVKDIRADAHQVRVDAGLVQQ